MEHEGLQRRSTVTIKNMGVNSYSQIISAFRAQGDLTEDQLNILPVLQNTLGISRERHTAEIKRALYDEQLSDIATSINSSSNTTNWEIEADYNCPTVVHRAPDTKYVQLAEHVLQTTPPSSIIRHQSSLTKAKLNHDLQRLVNDEKRQDGIINATQQQQQEAQINTIIKPNFNNIDIHGSKVVRLVRAKQATKRKTSLDTLIEVVQKELSRVNGQTNSISPSSSPPSHMRSFSSSKLQNRIIQSNMNSYRSSTSSILPSSHPASLTSQTNHSFKIARKRGTMNFNHTKRLFSLSQRNQSYNHDEDEHNFMDHNDIDDAPTGPENIEEIVRDTVDRLVAITTLNTAPYVVNMLTTIRNNGIGTHTESKVLTNMTTAYNTSTIKSQSTIPKSDYYSNDLTLHCSTNNDLRHSMQQTSPMKLQSSLSQQQQQQIHHSQLIIQPATTTPISTLQGTTTPTLFVAPRILNFQTVVPKPTTNIQIGNTKIILVSPSNITQHLPHSTTPIPSTTTSIAQQQQSPVKLVKFTSTNNNNNNTITNTNPLTTRSTMLPITTNQTSTLTLPKNVQIVIPSQTPSTIQLTRKSHDDSNKSHSTTTPTTTTTFRPVTTVPVTLTTCTVDQIPQAAQEVTITTSPTSSPPLTTTTSDLQQQTSLASITDNPIASSTIQQQSSILNVTTTRTSPTNDEMIKSVAVNFQQQQQQQPQQIQRPSSTHGPMIYRMTSVNPNVPVFRVRATTAPTSTAVLNKSIKTEPKSISVATANNMCYESKPTHNTSTTSGSVSVLACFKTTKKRNRERAIMPRPSATDLNDTSNDLQQQQQQQRSVTPSNNNSSLILNSDISNSNLSSDYRQQTSVTSPRFVEQTSLSSTLSDDNPSNILSLSSQEQSNDTTTLSSNSIPISRNDNNEFNSIKAITTPNISPPTSPLHSTPKLTMEDKSIQCIGHNNTEEQNQMQTTTTTDAESKKRSIQNDNWIVVADSILHDILLNDDCQQNLSTELNLIQANLANGILSSKDELINSIGDIKRKLSDDNLENLFQYFESEFSKRCDEINELKRFRPE